MQMVFQDSLEGFGPSTASTRFIVHCTQNGGKNFCCHLCLHDFASVPASSFHTTAGTTRGSVEGTGAGN